MIEMILSWLYNFFYEPTVVISTLKNAALLKTVCPNKRNIQEHPHSRKTLFLLRIIYIYIYIYILEFVNFCIFLNGKWEMGAAEVIWFAVSANVNKLKPKVAGFCLRGFWPFTKMFQKIRLDFWGVSAEDFRERRNIRKGTPGRHVLNEDSYFIFSKLPFKPVWGLRERFS